jgi:peptidyl-prolyl cis-trans isomerase SurA
MIVVCGVVCAAMGYHAATAAAVSADATPIDRVVAIVNDDVVTETELDREVKTVKKRLSEQNIALPSSDLLRSQVLNRLITKRLQLQLAQKSGIRVDDETLNKTVERIAEQNKLTLPELRDVIERDGFNFAAFREDIRDEVTISRLKQRQVESNIVVTDQEVDQFIANESGGEGANDEFRISHILVAVPESASPDKLQAARAKAEGIRKMLSEGADFEKVAIEYSDGRQALDGGDLGWRKAKELPSIFSRIAPKMKVGEISDIIRSPSGFHIIKLAGRHRGERHMITEHRARHILLSTNDVVDDTAARKKLLDLRNRIEQGADFSELARADSDDKGSAEKGGDLGWVKPGDVDPDFEQAVEALKPGEISMPFKTQFGWHIAQLLEVRQVDDTEDFNRTKAREAIRQRKVDEQYQEWLRRLRDEAYVVNRLND